MADPVFLARLLAASLVSVVLALCAANGVGESPSPADKAAIRVIAGH